MSYWLDGKFFCVDKISQSVFNDVIVPFFQNTNDKLDLNTLAQQLVSYKVFQDIQEISLGNLYAMATSCLGNMRTCGTVPPEAITLCQKAQKGIEKLIYSRNKMYL